VEQLVDREIYPNFGQLAEAVLDAWPEHRRYLKTNFAERRQDLLEFSEHLSTMIVKLSANVDGGLASLAADYRFISEKIVLPEEIYFRRHNEYRLKTFADALEQVYANTAFMNRYMNGLLITDVLWINHCKCMKHYVQSFLPNLPPGAQLLEIGPGHGLLLCLATAQKSLGKIRAWDVSEASRRLTRHSLDVLAPGAEVSLELRDLFDEQNIDNGQFDAIVFSEVLEHMEDPVQAVRALHRLCRPGGKVWINVPANSPAPDHLYLVRHPDEAAKLIESVGFTILETANFSMSGRTLEKAIKDELTVSCIVVGQKPA
jgi:2-polyprenyl-3-methyl-5-hydroxy-6-metoxy-1,4-benzoquinol methylase